MRQDHGVSHAGSCHLASSAGVAEARRAASSALAIRGFRSGPLERLAGPFEWLLWRGVARPWGATIQRPFPHEQQAVLAMQHDERVDVGWTLAAAAAATNATPLGIEAIGAESSVQSNEQLRCSVYTCEWHDPHPGRWVVRLVYHAPTRLLTYAAAPLPGKSDDTCRVSGCSKQGSTKTNAAQGIEPRN